MHRRPLDSGQLFRQDHPLYLCSKCSHAVVSLGDRSTDRRDSMPEHDQTIGAANKGTNQSCILLDVNVRRKIIRGFSMNKWEVERQDTDLGKPTRGKQCNGIVIMDMNDGVRIRTQPKNFTVKIVAHTSHPRADQNISRRDVGNNDILHAHFFERHSGRFGVSHTMWTPVRRDTHRHVAKRIVDIPSVSNKTRITKECLAYACIKSDVLCHHAIIPVSPPPTAIISYSSPYKQHLGGTDKSVE